MSEKQPALELVQPTTITHTPAWARAHQLLVEAEEAYREGHLGPEWALALATIGHGWATLALTEPAELEGGDEAELHPHDHRTCGCEYPCSVLAGSLELAHYG